MGKRRKPVDAKEVLEVYGGIAGLLVASGAKAGTPAFTYNFRPMTVNEREFDARTWPLRVERR